MTNPSTAQAPTPSRTAAEHWLLRTAHDAGWTPSEPPVIAARAAVSEAWGEIVRTCGVDEDAVLSVLAARFKLPVARWDLAEPHVTKLLPEKLAERYHVFPLRETMRTLVVATADPTDLAAEQDLSFAAGRQVSFELATPSAIRTALHASYEPMALAALKASSGAGLAAGLVAEAVEQDQPTLVVAREEADAPPIVNLVNVIMTDGVKRRASDIHIEPGRHEGVVRFRVDGVMHEYLRLPASVVTRVVSRIKILGQMDIADRMRPQDGRARILFDHKTIDLRLSTVPTRDHEKAVIRILDGGQSKSLEEIGFPEREYRRIKALLRQRDGIVVVTGPTGSGKTTTLYSAIREIASGSVNVVTIEDPVEYDLAGITQIQVETKRGVTFAGALRAVLRQDPDVILVGEVRDGETATTAAHAALTGHLVLTTLHTNDAVGAVQRLLDLDLDLGTVGDALRGVIAQRLVRRLCPQCAVPATEPLTPDETRLAALAGTPPVNRAVGCDHCGQTGYRGRLAVPEVLVISEPIERLIADGAPMPAILTQARAEGMRLLHEVALDAVRDGRTTLDEVERVIGLPEDLREGLPAETVAAIAAITAPSAPAPIVPVASSEPAAAGPALVLLADDDPVVRTAASAIVRSAGLRVEEVSDGFTALQRLLSDAPLPDLLLLDLNMPGIDGHVVVRQLRHDPRTRRLPIVILTGSGDRDRELQLMDDGADDYLTKPIDPERLLARLRAVLRRAAMR